jgi:hypothetical protein
MATWGQEHHGDYSFKGTADSPLDSSNDFQGQEPKRTYPIIIAKQ